MADPAERCREIDARLERAYPEATCALQHADPLQLLIATILSAQCTDERVNQVTPQLFRNHPRPQDYLAVSQEALEEEIRSTGFFRNKAKSIRGACQRIVEVYGGEVPRSMEELLTLPGVATAGLPLVISMHGDGGNGASARASFTLETASMDGAVFVYPSAPGGTFEPARFLRIGEVHQADFWP